MTKIERRWSRFRSRLVWHFDHLLAELADPQFTFQPDGTWNDETISPAARRLGFRFSPVTKRELVSHNARCSNHIIYQYPDGSAEYRIALCFYRFAEHDPVDPDDWFTDETIEHSEHEFTDEDRREITRWATAWRIAAAKLPREMPGTFIESEDARRRRIALAWGDVEPDPAGQSSSERAEVGDRPNDQSNDRPNFEMGPGLAIRRAPFESVTLTQKSFNLMLRFEQGGRVAIPLTEVISHTSDLWKQIYRGSRKQRQRVQTSLRRLNKKLETLRLEIVLQRDDLVLKSF